MTPQEINNEVERLAKGHATVEQIAAFILANVPNITPEAAAERAIEWANTNATATIAKEKRAVEFFDAEVTRLRELYQLRTAIFPNLADDIYCPVVEFIDDLITDTIRVNLEDEGETMKIGTKVRRKDSTVTSVVIKHGFVINNHILFEAELKPFAELTLVNEPLEYAVLHHPETFTPEQQAIRKGLAAAIFVEWHDGADNVICRGWHSPDQLEEMPQ